MLHRTPNRSSCCFYCQSGGSRCPRDMESSHFSRCCTCGIRLLCLPRNSCCRQSWSSTEMATLYAFFDSDSFTDYELCIFEVWGGWSGCSEVRNISPMAQCRFLLQHHRSLRPLIVALIPGQQRSLDKLKAMRLRLSNEVAAVINEFGPKLYDDFDEVCSSYLICIQY